MYRPPHVMSYARVRRRRSKWPERIALFLLFIAIKCVLLLAPFAAAWGYVAINGMPHLLFDYSYTEMYNGQRIYDYCTYLNWESVRISHGPDCPLIAFLK